MKSFIKHPWIIVLLSLTIPLSNASSLFPESDSAESSQMEAQQKESGAPGLKEIPVPAGVPVEISEDLKDGFDMTHLSWASREGMNCFSTKDHRYFRGNHRLYLVKLPAYSEMKVQLTPEGKSNINLYGMLQLPDHKGRLPAETHFTPLCQASFSRTRIPPVDPRAIFLKTSNQDYFAIIGAAGPVGTTSGAFRIRIDLQTSSDNPSIQDPPEVQNLTLPREGRLELSGNLRDGKPLPVRWANRTDAMCFPPVLNKHFKGNQLFYRITIPASTKTEITAFPDYNVDINLVVYKNEGGVDGKKVNLPPDGIPQRCESSTTFQENPGVREKVTFYSGPEPYDAIILVASPHGVTEGDFKLVIQSKREHPTGWN